MIVDNKPPGSAYRPSLRRVKSKSPDLQMTTMDNIVALKAGAFVLTQYLETTLNKGKLRLNKWAKPVGFSSVFSLTHDSHY